MVGKYVCSYIYNKNGKNILAVKLINSRKFEKMAFFFESDRLDISALADKLLDIRIGTPIAIDVEIVPNIVTGEKKVYYNNIYFASEDCILCESND